MYPTMVTQIHVIWTLKGIIYVYYFQNSNSLLTGKLSVMKFYCFINAEAEVE
jgi:hypothetical protein